MDIFKYYCIKSLWCDSCMETDFQSKDFCVAVCWVHEKITRKLKENKSKVYVINGSQNEPDKRWLTAVKNNPFLFHLFPVLILASKMLFKSYTVSQQEPPSGGSLVVVKCSVIPTGISMKH